jgi:hypothetical protein
VSGEYGDDWYIDEREFTSEFERWDTSAVDTNFNLGPEHYWRPREYFEKRICELGRKERSLSTTIQILIGRMTNKLIEKS